MKQQTTIAESIDAVTEKEKYDAACKRVLSEKIILAWIMKSCLSAYHHCDVNEIATRYIEGEPVVSSIPLAPDESNANGRIHGMGTEDTTLTEGKTTYDIRYRALLPDTDEPVEIIINIEAQNDSDPGYPLVKRGVFYCGRMISSQYGVDFTHSEYGKLKKVFSIWICIDPPKARENTITEYTLTEKNLVGQIQEAVSNYDLLSVILIGLGSERSETDSDILNILNVLLGSESDAAQKKEYLQNGFAIPMTEHFEREVSEMCNLGDHIEQKGIERGIEQGRSSALRSLIEHTGWTIERAMDALGILPVERAGYVKLLAQ